MKWLFGALVLLNLGLFMWASWIREPESGPGPQPLAAVNPEQLLPIATPGLKLRPRAPAPEEPAPLAEVAVPEAHPVVAVERCHVIGPFAQREEARRAGARLTAGKVSYRLKAGEGGPESAWWLFLPAGATREEAEKKVRELQGLGVRDLFAMEHGQQGYVVSLGLFTRRDNADKRRAELEAKKIGVRVEERQKARAQYWLSLNADGVAAPLLKELQRAYPGGPGGTTPSLQEAPCAEAAKGQITSRKGE